MKYSIGSALKLCAAAGLALALSACSSSAESVIGAETVLAADEPVSEPPSVVETTTTTTGATTTTGVTTTTEVTSTSTTVAPVAPAVDPILEPIVAELRAETGIPLRFPQLLSGFDEEERLDVETTFATVTYADPDSYVVTLGLSPECQGGNVCRIGTLTGRRIGPDGADTSGVPIALPKGQGEFFDATCGANCGDGFVRWVEEDSVGLVEYTVGSKLAPGAPMLAWAWSAIDGDREQPRPPRTCEFASSADQSGRRALVVPQTVDEGGHITHWLVICGGEMVLTEVVAGPGEVRVASLGESEIVIVEYETGGAGVFFNVSPLVEAATGQRVLFSDLRCGDVTGDGSTDLVDAVDGRGFELLGSRIPFEVSAESAAGLPRC